MGRKVPKDRMEGLWNNDRGLTSQEANQLRAAYGTNHIVESMPHPWRDLIVDTVKDPMLWFFAATGILYWTVNQPMEALTLAVAIVPLIGMDLFLHRRTAASTEGLRGRLSTTATVVRDGLEQTIASAEIVPGDLLIVSAGVTLPADAVIVAGSNIQIDESVLTGEAYPVEKVPSSIMARGAIDDVHWALAGTRMLTGQARLRAVYTGGETLYGEIVRSAIHGRHELTSLQVAIRGLVQKLLWAALLLCVLLAAVRFAQGWGKLDAFISAVTLALAAIPEEFPVVFTFYLGIGVWRLARRQALVRRAATVESIGRVSVICTDKTGTLTEGRLRLAHTLPATSTSEERLLQLASLASRAESADPLDDAILTRAPSVSWVGERRTFPFTEDTKREAVIVRDPSGSLLVACKGATETVLSMSTMSDLDRKHWTAVGDQLAESAHKVIAVAERRVIEDQIPSEVPATGYSFAGLLAFEDPLKEGAREAVQACRSAGIHLILVTGDHILAACAVAREVGLGRANPNAILGDELDAYVTSGRPLREIDVVARAKPAQKLLLVQSLKRLGEIVAVTGDGVNDVPALQAADIGVAMGERGTRSAREAAAIVLLDDNLLTMASAIGEGRQFFENLQQSFHYLLVIHIPLVLTAAVIPLMGFPLLYLPIHIVWLEIVIHPTAMLAFQNPTREDVFARRRPHKLTRIFEHGEWTSILFAGAAITAAIGFGYIHSAGEPGGTEHGRAMALATLTFSSALICAARSQFRTRASQVISFATAGSAIALIQVPFASRLLHLRPLHWDEWALALAGALAGAAVSFGLRRSKRQGRVWRLVC